VSLRVLVLCFLWANVGCKKSEGYVAELEQITAQVERMPGTSAPWQPARIGDRFVLGSAVRTGPASRARLQITGGGVLKVDPNAVVRFTSRPGRKRADVRVEAGSVELESGDEALGFGDAMLEPHGRALVSHEPEGTRISVTLGRALLEGGDAPTVIAAGRSVVVPTEGTAAAKVAIPRDAASSPEPVAGAFTIKVTGAAARRTTSNGPEPLPIGVHQLAPGTEISVPAGSTLDVSRGGARAVVKGAAELRIGGNAGALVTIARGTVALHAGAGDAQADVPGGSIAARAKGSEVAATITGSRGTEVEARVGDGTIRTAAAEEALATGDAATLAPDGTITFKTRAPTRAMISVAAGESPVIHAPRAPIAVRVRFGDACPGAALLEVAKDRSFKRVVARSGARADGANVLLGAGSFAYRVRCDDGRGATGTIKVTRDSGRASLPKAAARTLVEADGREYTILYENLLPELTLSWRTAPAANSYTFLVKPKHGAAKRFASATPRTSLRAGELGEGRYEFWAESASGRRSEATQIVIDFNNAAASASLESVEVKGGKVRVRGVVIEDSTVTAGGTPVELDRHRRFNAEIAALASEDGVGLRIAHPRAGIHYYVMSIDSR